MRAAHLDTSELTTKKPEESADFSVKKKFGSKVFSIAQSYKIPDWNHAQGQHHRVKTMVATRSQASIVDIDKSKTKLKDDDTKFIEESAIQNLNFNLFSHRSSRNYEAHPIEAITKGSNSLLEEDSTTCAVISAVKYQAPVRSPKALAKSPNIKI